MSNGKNNIPEWVKKSIDHILKEEGGFVNHFEDPGGATNFGITKSVYEDYLGKEVSVRDVKNMPREHAVTILFEDYFLKLHLLKVPRGIALSIFDFAVNAGRSRATKETQKMFDGCAVDGILGSSTLRYLNNVDVLKFVLDYADNRKEFYKSLSTFPTFGRGWINRTNNTTEESIRMAIKYGEVH